jgi:hypothetical protein
MENFDFDDYLNGTMPADLRTAFEQQLAVDANLRRKFQVWEEWRNNDVTAEKSDLLRRNFRQGLATYRAKQRKSQMLWLLAAVLAVLLLGLAWYLYQPKRDSAAALYVAHFQPNIDFSAERSGTPAQDVFQKIELAYTQKNYRLTLELLQQNKPSVPSSAYELLTGQLWLLEGQPDSAIAHLNRVNIGATAEKHWYLALAYLRLEDVKNAEKQLIMAQKSGGPFAEKAKSLFFKLPISEMSNDSIFAQ